MRVLVHLQGNARDPLYIAVEELNPKGVIVITNRGLNDEGLLVLEYLNRRDTRRLGPAIADVTHTEVLFIDEVASSKTVEEVLLAFSKAQDIAQQWSDGRPVEVFAGLTGGTKPMVIGGTIATLLGGLKPYYVSKAMLDREEHVHDLGHLSGLSSAFTWATTDRHAPANMEHLRVLMALESEGGNDRFTSTEVAERSERNPTPRAVQNAMKVLKRFGLVEFEEERKPLRFVSTPLAALLLKIL
jgi:hypothetical protein